ncbi:MAG: type IV secretory system conjugative DNA transfer family protein [Rhodospirillales bacterium]|nr:type IV secretory system conjugative DNA transfer family protein [Rhodospirillales bacterium]
MVIGKTIASFGVMAAVGGFVASNLTAWRLGHQAALGPPLAHYHDWPLYAPWDILAWAPWQGTVPAIHAGLIVAAGITALPLLPLAKRFTRPSFGQKEWGSRRDARRAGLLSRDPRGGIVLGMLGREIMTFSGDQHTLVAGASGSGKTAGPVLTTLLSCRDRSMLVFDPKGELYRMSAPFRSSVGAAFFFDPTEPDSACFNPLAEIPVGTSREIAAVQNIASILVDSSGQKNSEPIWPITATDLLTAIILYAVTGIPAPQRHLGTLRELMFEMPTTLEKMARGKNDECQRVGATMLAMTPKTADAIALTARSALSVFADPLVVEKTSRSDFRISDLVCSRYPMSLYLQVPPSDRDRVMPLFRLMLVQIFKAFLYRTDVMADGRKKRHRLQLVADEFPRGRQDPRLRPGHPGVPRLRHLLHAAVPEPQEPGGALRQQPGDPRQPPHRHLLRLVRHRLHGRHLQGRRPGCRDQDQHDHAQGPMVRWQRKQVRKPATVARAG